MGNRSVIDLACGMIMAQNRCSKDEAFEVLTRASNDSAAVWFCETA